jgi:heme-degrading monooxygenase HmoA
MDGPPNGYKKGAQMTVRVLINYKFPPSRETEVLPILKELRIRVPQQPGYISSEYLKRVDAPHEMVVISTWNSINEWNSWFKSKDRYITQSKLDEIPGVKTEYSIYGF